MCEKTFAQLGGELRQAASVARSYCESAGQDLACLGSLAPSLEDDAKKEEAELGEALEKFTAKTQNPVVRIAAIGTTSSAKSSMLNFLCGAELLPVAVQEKSAGVTRIRNAPQPGLVVENTRGALWQTGRLEISSPEEIRQALDLIMDSYRHALYEGMDLEAPAFIVEYPLFLDRVLNLPQEFTLELLDLPGLKFIGDERNRRVMAECKEALCLVAFGAHETDPAKQEAFLNSAMDQIALIDAPLQRMFFVATRVDEFLLHDPKDWPKNEQSFLESRLKAIKTKIAERYGAEEAANLRLHRLSPLPALYALTLMEHSDLSVWKLLKSSFLGLVEGGRDGDPGLGVDTDELPAFVNWSDEDRGRVVEQLWVTTGAGQFLRALSDVLLKNLPAIVLAPPFSGFEAVCRDLDNWFRSGADLARSHIRGEMRKYLALLDKAIHDQHDINSSAAMELKSFLAAWSELVFQDSFVGKAGADDWQRFWSRFPRFRSPMLEESERWGTDLRTAFLKPVNAVRDYWLNGIPLPDSLPGREELQKKCDQLAALGYSPWIARYGKEKITTDRRDKMLVDEFDIFIKDCGEISRTSLELAIGRMLDRTLLAMDRLQAGYLEYLDKMNGSLPPEIRNVAKITSRGLNKFTRYRIKRERPVGSTIDVKEYTEDETREVDNLSGNWAIDLWRRITGNAKVKKVFKILKFHIRMPSLAKVYEDFEKQFKTDIPLISKVIEDAAQEKMNEFLANITAYQTALYDAFRKNLELQADRKSGDVASLEKRLDQSLANMKQAAEQLEQIKNLYS